MAQIYSQPWERFLTELKSRNDDTRRKAALKILRTVQAAQRELPPQTFSSNYEELIRKVLSLVQSNNDVNERLGGLLAIQRLVEFRGEDVAQKTTRFHTAIKRALQSNDTIATVVAAETLGVLVRHNAALAADIVDAEIKISLEWLQIERQENRHFAAVEVLKHLASASPTLFYGYVPQILEVIWIALRDPKNSIREAAASTVSQCFTILQARDPQIRQEWLSRTYDEINRGLQIGSLESIHGSLLTLRELLIKGGMFMQGNRYKETCDKIFMYKDNRELLIRREVINTIPIMAGYHPKDFANLYLHRSMSYLQGIMKNAKGLERNIAFQAVGKISQAVQSAIGPYLDNIILLVREALSVKNRVRVGDDAAIFECLSMISIAVGQTLSKYMEALLDPIFACGLSEALTQALVDMAHYVPPVRGVIQDKLLEMLSKVLCGRSFQLPGQPGHANALPPIYTKEIRDRDPVNLGEQKEIELRLALQTLGSFDFSGHMLNEFVHDVAIRYTEDDDSTIRRNAALTCCQLLVKDPIVFQTSRQAIKVVSDIVERLLTLAVADADIDNRKMVLSALDGRFDSHLAKAENVRTLFIAVNDEVFTIRQEAMIILGRLTRRNPAYVFPSLRKVLIQLLTEIEFSNNPRNKEESAKLISCLASATPKLTKPYVDSMVNCLLPKTDDPNPEVASTTLRAIGDLTSVGGEDMVKFIPALMHVVVRDLQDQGSTSKRSAALTTLHQLASNSGYVVDPYLDHPELLDILISMIEHEPANELRKNAIKLLGVLGALDPYRHQIMEQTPEKALIAESQQVTDVGLIMNGMSPSNDEYYPTIVIQTLIGMLKEPSLSQHYTSTVDAIMTIYKTMGLKCVSFLGQVVPGILHVLKEGDDKRREACFSQLAILVKIVKQHIRPHLPAILNAIQDHWKEGSGQQATMLALIESIAGILEGEFNVYLSRVLPLMLDVLEQDTSPRRSPSERVLKAFLTFGSSAEEFMHLIIPVVVSLFDRGNQPVLISKSAMETIGRLSRSVNISEFAARIIHPLTRVLSGPESSLKQTALDTICALIFQLGKEYLAFAPTVSKILTTQKVPHTTHTLLVSKLQKGESLPDFGSDERKTGGEDVPNAEAMPAKLPVNQQHLKNAWEASAKSTREDWHEWMRRLSTELIRESPSHALRACTTLANIYSPIARTLFNSAFVSCWTELYDQYQEELVRAIETAMTSPHIPPEIIQTLLNLAEFMEHDDKSLPIDIRTLGMYAGKCHAFAKALHYKELEFNTEQNSSAVEALISINNQLQQTDAAFGILRKAQGYHDVDLQETWFEKLGRWEDALEAYQKKEQDDPTSFDVVRGKMRCLHALGEWDILSSLAQEKWIGATIDQRKDIAAAAASAAWGMGQWDLMDNYLQVMKPGSADRSFFGAIITIHRNQFEDARKHIGKARDGLDNELGALLGESYTRAYNVVVRVQLLAELEEIIQYKQIDDDRARQAQMRRLWTKRLLGCQRNVEVWQRLIKVRALVLGPSENEEMLIKFASICRKNHRNGLAEKALGQLIGHSSNILGPEAQQKTLESAFPIQFAVYQYMWSCGSQQQALHNVREFTHRLKDAYEAKAYAVNQTAQQLANGVNGTNGVNGSHAVNGYQDSLANSVTLAATENDVRQADEWRCLLARSYRRQGDWMSKQLGGDWQSDQISEVLNCYRQATRYNPDWYKAWHAWALANFEVVTSMTAGTDRESAHVSSNTIDAHIVPAIQGFFKSIALSNTSALQDTLRVLTLWFAHGNHQEVTNAVTHGMTTINIDTWLEVMPQLIARINQPNKLVRQSVHNMLCDIGRVHPQALVYPLTVAVNSDVHDRSGAARSIMATLEQHDPELCEQAGVVSHELIRIAVLWHELWHEALEEASRLYFGDDNIDGFLDTLAPLHRMMDKGPQTLRETSFIQSFGRDLQEARDWCNTFRSSGDRADLQQAWDMYYTVFKRIQKQLPQLTHLELQYVSPELKKVHDLELAIPGTYKPGKEVVRIISFDQMATVINSKQRPRRITMRGSDGNAYEYLLKGHEDIRQDERVMQLFGLVNTLLMGDSECLKRHLSIQRFSATPLSTQSGLLGWVDNTDTLHSLIREYRDTRKILLNIEHRIMLQMAPDYDNLTLMQKVEVFGYALDNTTGQDLYRVLWLKSKSSESWLERRTNYTRSLAVMSMVGYILGLGDRHPSNIMLDRRTGNVIHIDFGDCFEIAMHRDKYPERVPFRLTRMLTFAMEVSNIEGSFRTTCEHTMRVLRTNKESLIAVLEAFIHDPLLNWRLTTGKAEEPTSPPPAITDGTEHAQGAAAARQRRASNAVAAEARRGSIMGAQPDLEGSSLGSGRPPGTAARRRGSTLSRIGPGPNIAGASAVNNAAAQGNGLPQQVVVAESQQQQQQHSQHHQTTEENIMPREVQNAKALAVLARVKEKLNGRDFRKDTELDVKVQVERLLSEATSLENLCQHYIGWCSFW